MASSKRPDPATTSRVTAPQVTLAHAITRIVFWTFVGIFSLFTASLLVGCGSLQQAPALKTRSEVEVATAAIKDEWLKKCEVIVTERPNGVGSLLLDYTDATAALAACISRQGSLVEYLAPIVQKARQGSQ